MLKKLFTRLFWTRKKIIISILSFALILAAIFLGGGNGDQNIITVEKGDVVEEVVITGKVKAGSQVDMGFDRSGRVARVYASVGDTVKQGQILAELDYSEEAAQVIREESLLKAEQIKLEEIRRNGPSSLREAETSLSSAVNEAYSSADNAVRNKVDQFFKTPRTNPIFEIKITDGNFIHYFNIPSDLVLDINNGRRSVEVTLSNWPTDANEAIKSLNIISDFLDKVALAVNSFTPAEYDYEATVASYKTALDTARSSVAGARAKVIAGQEKLSSSPVLGSSGVSSVASQEAKVAQMQASVSSIKASINKFKVVAPFEGVVTLQEAKVGEAVSSQDKLISLISDDVYLEANVSEINVGKVKVGDTAVINFDAFTGQSFAGKVTFVDPAETIIDQVVNYKLRIEFGGDAVEDPSTNEVKSGLTANVRIKTKEKPGVLSIPSYTIEKEGGKNFVNVVAEDSESVKREVETGLVGSDGKVEILSGLNEGDKILFTN